MADDKVLLPGTEIEIKDKYGTEEAPGKRLDFPNFGEVCKVTYAKGIITDFEKVQDDPIQVKSLVKVEVEGVGESEFIPILFHPKKQYWDDPLPQPPGALAMAFNADGEYTERRYEGPGYERELIMERKSGVPFPNFEKAWMSFRCGDEVAVMLKKGVPVAVLAYTDRVPRIGENIIKAIPDNAIDKRIYLNLIDLHTPYAGGELGPDGINLGLILQYNYRGIITKKRKVYKPYGITLHPPNGWPSGITALYYAGITTEYKVMLWTIKVGPILYAIFGRMYQPIENYEGWYWPDASGIPSESYHPELLEWESYNLGLPSEFAFTEQWPLVGELALTPPNLNPGRFSSIIVKAGIYSEELENEVVESLSIGNPVHAYFIGTYDWWPYTPDEMKYQSDLSYILEHIDGFCKTGPYGVVMEPNRLQWFTRPHTKEELIEAGMWPEEDE